MARQGENPLDRLKSAGPRAASILDLLAVAFSRTETDAKSGETMAQQILTRFPAINTLSDAAQDDLKHPTGLDEFEILRARALMEIGRRAGTAGKGEKQVIESAQDAYAYIKHLSNEKREHFVAILMDAKGGVQRVATIHVGTLTMSLVGPREVFREAIRDGASSIIVGHNHPSGDPTPSQEDIEVTAKLVEIGEMLDIPVLDHIIVGDRRYTSFKEKRLI